MIFDSLRGVAIQNSVHTEHYPQAVFIAVILDRMLQICNTFPEYNIDQITNTHDLLTISVIFYLTVNK